MAEVIKVDIVADAGRFTPEVAKATAGLTKFSAASNRASQSVNDLSRIVQDAPFGFIGISNNLNPLIESFGRLKAETGSVGGAFKSLAGQLIGPAGIGFAVSLVSSALVVFGDQLFSTKKETDALTESTNKYKDALIGVAQNSVASAAKINALFQVAKNDSLSSEQRQNAIDQINKLFGEYGKTVTLANVATQEITGQIQKYITATLAQQTAQKAADRVAELQIRRQEIQFELSQKQGKYNDILSKTQEDINKAGQGAVGIISAQNDANKDLSKTKIALASVDAELKTAQGLLTRATVVSTSSFGDLGQKVKETNTRLKELKDTYKEIRYEVSRVKPLPPISDNEIINAQGPETEKDVNSLPDKIEVPLNVKLVGSKDFNDEINKKVFQPIYNANEALIEAIDGTINSLIEGISGALAGEGIGGLFKGLLNVVGDFLIKLGLAAIGIGQLYASLQSAPYSPLKTVAQGIAALALGAIIKAFVPQFAVGTRNAPGGLALVGERGPELVNIPSGARVTPAAQTAAALNGMGDSIRVYGVMRGRDIYFTNKRYGNTFNTTT